MYITETFNSAKLIKFFACTKQGQLKNQVTVITPSEHTTGRDDCSGGYAILKRQVLS